MYKNIEKVKMWTVFNVFKRDRLLFYDVVWCFTPSVPSQNRQRGNQINWKKIRYHHHLNYILSFRNCPIRYLIKKDVLTSNRSWRWSLNLKYKERNKIYVRWLWIYIFSAIIVDALPGAAAAFAVLPPKMVDQSLGGAVTGSVTVGSVTTLLWPCVWSIFACRSICNCCFCRSPIPGIWRPAALFTCILEVSADKVTNFYKNLKKTTLSKSVHFVQRTYQHTCCIVFLYILITEHMFLSLPCKEGPKTEKSLVLYIALKHISSILFHERERKWVRTYFFGVRNAFKFRLF